VLLPAPLKRKRVFLLLLKEFMKYYLSTTGIFGHYGGRYVPIDLEIRLKKLEQIYLSLRRDRGFKHQLSKLYRDYANRPSPLYYAQQLTQKCGGAKIYLKREDLNHTGAHKINNALGQVLVAQAMGAQKLIAETGAGQHGVAVATVAARFGLSCDVYMGQRDIINQKVNVDRMHLLGARVIAVTNGQKTLKDAVDAALNAYIKEPHSYYLLGSAVGPHPYPLMVHDFQAVIGQEAHRQIKELTGKLPDYVVACVGGGSNAIGIMSAFINHPSVFLIGVEPAGKGIQTHRHGLSLQKGKPGIIHGFKCLVLTDKNGQITESYSAASGLDYPGVGPELSSLKEIGRLEAVGITDQEAVKAFTLLSQPEGVIPALESAHAIAQAVKLAPKLPKETVILVNLSGRGDKDVENVFENLR